MIRMLLIGYCCGIRSERRLCHEVSLNLAYRRFCRLELTDPVPDRSTFSKNRHGRFRDSDLLRKLFEASVRRCMAEGIVGGEGFAVDASMIRADAHHQHGVATSADLEQQDATRAVNEYLAVLDDAAFGAATDVAPKFISPVDPAARWTAAAGGPACYAYCDNYLIDLKCAVIVDVEPTTAVRQAEVTAAKTMITRTTETFGLEPERLAADTGYGSAKMLAWLVHEQGEHGGQRAGGVARQRRARMGAVMGGNGSDDVVSATRIDGHSSGVLGCAKAAPGQDAGTSIPVARIRSCETGLSWGKLRFVRNQSFPGPRPDVHGPPHRRALAFLGFWVRAAPQTHRESGAVVDQLARRNRVAGSGEIATGAIMRAAKRRRLMSGSRPAQVFEPMPKHR